MTNREIYTSWLNAEALLATMELILAHSVLPGCNGRGIEYMATIQEELDEWLREAGQYISSHKLHHTATANCEYDKPPRKDQI